MPQVARLIQEQLAQIGIRVRIDEEKDRPNNVRDASQKRIGHMALFDSSPLSTYRVLREKISSEIQGLWWQGVEDRSADQLIALANQIVLEPDRRTAYDRCLSCGYMKIPTGSICTIPPYCMPMCQRLQVSTWIMPA